MSKMDIIYKVSSQNSQQLTDAKTKLYLRLNNTDIPLITFTHLNEPKDTIDLDQLKILDLTCAHEFQPLGLVQERSNDEAPTAYSQCIFCQKIKTSG